MSSCTECGRKVRRNRLRERTDRVSTGGSRGTGNGQTVYVGRRSSSVSGRTSRSSRTYYRDVVKRLCPECLAKRVQREEDTERRRAEAEEQYRKSEIRKRVAIGVVLVILVGVFAVYRSTRPTLIASDYASSRVETPPASRPISPSNASIPAPTLLPKPLSNTPPDAPPTTPPLGEEIVVVSHLANIRSAPGMGLSSDRSTRARRSRSSGATAFGRW